MDFPQIEFTHHMDMERIEEGTQPYLELLECMGELESQLAEMKQRIERTLLAVRTRVWLAPPGAQDGNATSPNPTPSPTLPQSQVVPSSTMEEGNAKPWAEIAGKLHRVRSGERQTIFSILPSW